MHFRVCQSCLHNFSKCQTSCLSGFGFSQLLPELCLRIWRMHQSSSGVCLHCFFCNIKTTLENILNIENILPIYFQWRRTRMNMQCLAGQLVSFPSASGGVPCGPQWETLLRSFTQCSNSFFQQFVDGSWHCKIRCITCSQTSPSVASVSLAVINSHCKSTPL